MPTHELSEVLLYITLKDNKVFKYLSWAHPWVSVLLTQYLMTVSTAVWYIRDSDSKHDLAVPENSLYSEKD